MKLIKFLKRVLRISREKLLIVIGMLCILYFIAITIFIGYFNVYNFIWIFMGALFILLYKLRIKIVKLLYKTKKIIRLFILIILSAFALSFVIIETFIILESRNKNTENGYYLIVLGAGLDGANPSLTLLQRINKAVEFLDKNMEAMVVVSGGKGVRETVTEAEVMSKILQNNKIAKTRIIMEDRSSNTYENLLYSGNLIEKNKKVVIVSSGFHLFRAKSIAKKMGYKDVGGIASKTPLLLLPNYYIREYLAVLKEIIIKNI